LKFAAQHPGMFAAAASFSGNVDPLHSYCAGADGFDKPGLGCGADWTRVWGDPTIPAQRDIWQRNNPYDLAPKLAGTQLYVACGDGAGWDPIEMQVHVESRAFVDRLHSLGIPVTSRFYDGTHGWDDWQRELRTALPLLMSSIGA
jgi:S-formylglutathione hydrolase FrmB